MEELVDFQECVLVLMIGVGVIAPYVCESYVVVLTKVNLLLSFMPCWMLQWWKLFFTWNVYMSH